MSEFAKPLEDNEVEFVDEDESSLDEAKKAKIGFTPTQTVSWPFSKAQPPKEAESQLETAERAFDDFAASRVDDETNREMLGLK